MYQITITVETDNAAFEDQEEYELNRILIDVIRRKVAGEALIVRDANGNICGEVFEQIEVK